MKTSERGIKPHATKPGWFQIRVADQTGRDIRIECIGPEKHAKELKTLLKAAIYKAKRYGDTSELERLLASTRSSRREVTQAVSTFDEVLNDYLLELKRRYGAPVDETAPVNMRRFGAHLYTAHLRGEAYLKRFSGREVRLITSSEIKEYLDGLTDGKGKKAADSTYAHYRAVLCSILALAVENKKLAVSPMDAVPCKVFDNARTHFMDEDCPSEHREEKALRTAMRSSDAYRKREPEFDFFLYTGMRKNEPWKIKWSDVFIDVVRPYIHMPKRKNLMKGTLHINSLAIAALRKLKSYSDGSGFIFPSPDGSGHQNGTRAIDYSAAWLTEVSKLAGVSGMSPHVLRHTFASRMAMRGIDQRVIAKYMGHKSLKMTDRYSHLSDEHLASAVEMISDWGGTE